MKRKKAVVLLSGGIDSSTTLAVAKSEQYELFALSFDYNQRHKRELASAKMIASTLGVVKHLVIKFDLREIGGSALTSEMKVPKINDKKMINPPFCKGGWGRFSKTEQIPITYVPARNTIFLSFALAWAEVIWTENIFIGANAVDYSGYPDCRPEYLKAFEDMANLATKASVEGKLKFKIRAPLISMKKSEIIKKGIELGLDYSITWSCYDPQPKSSEVQKCKSMEEKNLLPDTSVLPSFSTIYVPCGRCDSCIYRAKGFKEAGIKDPLKNR